MGDKRQLEDKMRYLAQNMKTLTMKLKKEQELLESARHGQMLEPGIAHIPHCPLSNLADIDPNCKVHGPLFTILKGIKNTNTINKFTVPSNHGKKNMKKAEYCTEPNLISRSTVLPNVGLDSSPSNDTNLQSIFNTSDNGCVEKMKIIKNADPFKAPALSKSWLTLLNERDAQSEEETEPPKYVIKPQENVNFQRRLATPYYMPEGPKQRKIPDDTISKYLECYNQIENRNHKDGNINKNMMDDSFSITNIDNEIMNLSRMVETLTNKEE